MFFLIIQLFKQEYYDDLMLALTSSDISNATIVDGLNMDNVMNQHIPLFSGLIPNESHKRKYCKMVFSVVSSKDSIKVLLETFKQADIDFRKEEIGRIILLPATQIIDIDNDFKD